MNKKRRVLKPRRQLSHKPGSGGEQAWQDNQSRLRLSSVHHHLYKPRKKMTQKTRKTRKKRKNNRRQLSHKPSKPHKPGSSSEWELGDR